MRFEIKKIKTAEENLHEYSAHACEISRPRPPQQIDDSILDGHWVKKKFLLKKNLKSDKNFLQLSSDSRSSIPTIPASPPAYNLALHAPVPSTVVNEEEEEELDISKNFTSRNFEDSNCDLNNVTFSIDPVSTDPKSMEPLPPSYEEALEILEKAEEMRQRSASDCTSNSWKKKKSTDPGLPTVFEVDEVRGIVRRRSSSYDDALLAFRDRNRRRNSKQNLRREAFANSIDAAENYDRNEVIPEIP